MVDLTDQFLQNHFYLKTRFRTLVVYKILKLNFVFYLATYHKDFSTEKIYNNLIDIFTKLAETGIILNINGEEIEVFFVLGLFIGNTKHNIVVPTKMFNLYLKKFYWKNKKFRLFRPVRTTYSRSSESTSLM